MTDEHRIIDPNSTTVTFQLYRLDPQADTIERFQSRRLDEMSVDGGSISGTDTVAMIKERIRPWFQTFRYTPAACSCTRPGSVPSGHEGSRAIESVVMQLAALTVSGSC